MFRINEKQITIKKIINFILSKLKRLTKRILNFSLYIIDFVIPKRSDYWIYPVYCLGDGNFSDNILAVYNFVKDDKNIKKIIITRKKNIKQNGKNVVIVSMYSLKSIYYILRSKVIFLQHSLNFEFKESLFKNISIRKRKIINIWHGIAIKDISNIDIGFMNAGILAELPYHYINTSSEQDKKNMIKTFYKAKKDNFWIMGLPRNDFLVMRKDNLPRTIKDEIDIIKKNKKNKRLLTYMPTYRDNRGDGFYYDFTVHEIDSLKKYLDKNNACLGLRFHQYNKPISLIEKLLNEDCFIDLSDIIIENTVAIIRESSLIITDYSSLFLDALYIDKDVISFAYDYDNYIKNQHGFFYDFESIFPGKICKTFDELLEILYTENYYVNQEKAKEIKKTLFKYTDDSNSERIVRKVKELLQ